MVAYNCRNFLKYKHIGEKSKWSQDNAPLNIICTSETLRLRHRLHLVESGGKRAPGKPQTPQAIAKAICHSLQTDGDALAKDSPSISH